MSTNRFGHLHLMIATFIWGFTTVSVKLLLEDFEPIQVLVIRFMIGVFALSVINHKNIFRFTKVNELYYIFAGLFGICIFFYLYNAALLYTTASNVGILSALSPITTVIIAQLFLREKGINKYFLLGLFVSLVGVVLFYINGAKLKINPIGDLMVIMANICWGVYSVLLNKIEQREKDTVFVTRRIMFYGFIFLVIFMTVLHKDYKWSGLYKVNSWFYILFLSLGASVLSFVLWNKGIRIVGTTKSSAYGYLGPVISLASSILLLREKITLLQFLGGALIMSGVFVSERRKRDVDRVNKEDGEEYECMAS